MKAIEWQIKWIVKDYVLEGWLNLKQVLLNIRDQCVPLLTNKLNKCKWVTRKVIKCRRSKYKAWQKFCKIKTAEAREIYKKKRNMSLKVNRLAQKDYELKLAANIKKDSKSFFSYVNNKKKLGTKIGPLKDLNNNLVTDDLEMSNIINIYFSSVFTNDSDNLPNLAPLLDDNESLSSINISEQLVLKKLKELKTNKSPGPDDLHPKLLFELSKIISKPLAKLYTLSLNSGLIPNDWKLAHVTPLFKKGSKSECKNYRPVSLTSILCKILESIIKDSINEHLIKYSLIKNSQHGFRTGKSCLSNLLDFYNIVTAWLDKSNCVDIVYLDFAKAFDKVSHLGLMIKLQSLGITGSTYKWIKMWLSDRKQCVVINGHCSEWKDVSSGVPQGSVLGPILFTIFINDIDNSVKSKLSKFADDTKLGKVVNNESQAREFQSDLDKLYYWSKQWKMEFNLEKCVCMHVGYKNKNFNYHIGETVLKSVESEKDLGIIIDKNFKFTEQCANAVKKANQMLGIIKRKIKYKSKDVIVKLYKTLVRPHLEYCIQFWSPSFVCEKRSIESVQR